MPNAKNKASISSRFIWFLLCFFIGHCLKNVPNQKPFYIGLCFLLSFWSNSTFVMRKQRYTYTKSAFGRAKPYLNTLYFFAAWNLLGYAIWKKLKARASKNIEGFDEMSSSEQVMTMMGARPKTRVTIKNFTIEKIEPYEIRKKEHTEPIVQTEEPS